MVKGQRSRSPGRLMLRPEVRHIFRTGRPTNFNLGTQTEHEDPHQRQAQWPSRSKVKVAKSRNASDRCWPIGQERNVLETPELVERLRTPRAIMRSSFKTKDGVYEDPYCWDQNCIISTERENLRTSELVPQWSMRYQLLSRPTIIKLQSWVLARGRGHTVSAVPGGHAACYYYMKRTNILLDITIFLQRKLYDKSDCI